VANKAHPHAVSYPSLPSARLANTPHEPREHCFLMLDAGTPRSKGHPGALQRHRYALPLVKSVMVVTKRQITLMMRDGALTRGRFMQVCICIVSASSITLAARDPSIKNQSFGIMHASL